MKLFWFLIGIAVGMTLAAIAAPKPGVYPSVKAVPSVNPDPRGGWVARPVEGYGLCNRDTCITLPASAVLVLYHANRDSLWDAN